jgi:hypothetical protein
MMLGTGAGVMKNPYQRICAQAQGACELSMRRRVRECGAALERDRTWAGRAGQLLPWSRVREEC